MLLALLNQACNMQVVGSQRGNSGEVIYAWCLIFSVSKILY